MEAASNVSIQLRPYQESASGAIRASFQAGHNAPLLVSPCGSGKTVLFSYISQKAGERGNNTLILVHRQELLRQASRTLSTFDVDHGLIAPGMTFTRQPVQVASVQTLVRRMHMLRWKPDLIVVDEAHHALGKNTWGKVLSNYPDAKILGVTATPERLSGEGLGAAADGFFDDMVLGPSVKSLIGQGYLSPAEIYAPTNIDLSGVHTRAGEYITSELNAAVDKPTITGSAVDHYRRLGNREPAIAFCCSIAHAEHVAEQFRQAGYQSSTIDGKLDDRSRRQRITDLSTGTLNVLTSCDIVSEIDLPVVSVGIMLRPTQSLGLFIQQTGRAMRPYPGKKRALILDHTGGIYRHGMPDDDREWTLEGKKRNGRKSDPSSLPVRQCEECYYVHRPAPKCPKCGFVYPVQAREVEEVEGTLEQVDPEEVRRIQKREQAKAKSLDELKAIAKKRGYHHKWAEYVYAARQKSGRRSAAA